MFQIGLKKFLVLKKLKILSRDLNVKYIVRTIHEKELEKTNQKVFRVEKVIKRTGDKRYVKWKSYDSSFNIWIDKNDII